MIPLWLRRFFGWSPQEAAGSLSTTTTELRFSGNWKFEQEVVGESHYQDALGYLAETVGLDGADTRYSAKLVCERDNPYDSNAVAVFIDSYKVGYLPKSDASEYRLDLAKISRDLPDAFCRAKIVGGFAMKDRFATFGVKLDLVWPLKRIREKK